MGGKTFLRRIMTVSSRFVAALQIISAGAKIIIAGAKNLISTWGDSRFIFI